MSNYLVINLVAACARIAWARGIFFLKIPQKMLSSVGNASGWHWVEGMVAGKGWIALALTTFATWRPARVLLGAYLFGGVTMLQFHLQGRGVEVPSQFLVMLPYLATIVVLVLISRNPAWIRRNMPASLGKAFHPGA